MCDSITNGGPVSFMSSGGGGSCPPANVIIASNVLSTNGNVLCGNIISGDGTFTGNLYVAGHIVGNIIYSSINISGTANVSTLQAGTVQAGIYFGNGSGLSNLNASNLSGSANLTSLNTTSLSFQNAILSTNLPVFNAAQGTWGSSSNASQVTIDQYGRVSGAANIAITSSQWTTVAGNVAYQNGVSIGTLSAPPTGSNLYVLGKANIDALNTTSLSFQNSILATNLPILNTAQGTWGSSSNVAQVTVDQYGRVSAAANLAITSSQWTTIHGNVAYGNGVSIGTISDPPPGSNLYVLGTANINTLNVSTLFANSFGLQTLNVLGTSNLNIVYGQAYYGNGYGISNLNSSSLVGNVSSANVALVVSQPSQPNITSVGTLTSLNVSGISNTSSLVTPTANVGTLNVVSIVNLASLTTNLLASVANVGTLNVSSISVSGSTPTPGYALTTTGTGLAWSGAVTSQWTTVNSNVAYANGVSIGTLSNPPPGSNLYVNGTANVTSLNVSDTLSINGAFVSNSTNTTFLFDTLTIPYLNTLSVLAQGTSNMNVVNVTSLFVTTNVFATRANVGTLNVSTIETVSNLTASVANVGTLNVISVSNLASLTTNLVASVANVGTLNVSTIETVSNLTASVANVGTLNVISVSNLASLTTNLIASVANVGTLNVGTISNLSSLTTNLIASVANVGTLNVISISNLNSLTTTNIYSTNINVSYTGNIANLFVTTANLATLNVGSEFVTQLSAGNVTVSNSITVSNLTVSGNIIPVTQGNTYVQGNVVVAGNVYSSLGQLGAGGSLFFSLDSTYTPAYFTGNVPVAGTQTNKIRLDTFTQQGTSTYVSVSANGCFQFTQTGVYTVSSIFLTNYNNVLGIGIGSNSIDYGTRTDQTYLYSLIPFISQNPTGILEAQFYVSNTSNYYYVDTFSVDDVTLQPTSNVNGGTWIAIAPLGGVAAASQTITLSTLGATVTGQSTNYGAQITDYYIGCSAGITVTLPLGATLTAGKQYVIKDESGNATSSHITVASTSPNLIDGSSTVIISINYASVTVYWTGARWSIV